MFQALSPYFYFCSEMLQELSQRGLANTAEFKACVWIKRYMIQEEKEQYLLCGCVFTTITDSRQSLLK